LPSIYGKRKINRGFEGLALSADEKTIYAVLQSPLLNPDRKIGDASRNTRVLVFDIASEKVTAEYAYRFDVSKQFDPNPKNTPDEMKLSGVIAINPTTLLVLERTDLVAKLYSVDFSEASSEGAVWASSHLLLRIFVGPERSVGCGGASVAKITGRRLKLSRRGAREDRRHRFARRAHPRDLERQ
jgi:hypothetical protein